MKFFDVFKTIIGNLPVFGNVPTLIQLVDKINTDTGMQMVDYNNLYFYKDQIFSRLFFNQLYLIYFDHQILVSTDHRIDYAIATHFIINLISQFEQSYNKYEKLINKVKEQNFNLFQHEVVFTTKSSSAFNNQPDIETDNKFKENITENTSDNRTNSYNNLKLYNQYLKEYKDILNIFINDCDKFFYKDIDYDQELDYNI